MRCHLSVGTPSSREHCTRSIGPCRYTHKQCGSSFGCVIGSVFLCLLLPLNATPSNPLNTLHYNVVLTISMTHSTFRKYTQVSSRRTISQRTLHIRSTEQKPNHHLAHRHHEIAPTPTTTPTPMTASPPPHYLHDGQTVHPLHPLLLLGLLPIIIISTSNNNNAILLHPAPSLLTTTPTPTPIFPPPNSNSNPT